MSALLPALVLVAALPSWLHLPAWAERWLYNPRERTATALDEVAHGQPGEAVPPLDTAARLADDPTVQYNAGAGHLLAEQAKEAVPYLEKAVEKAPPALRPQAEYNLGNAKLAAGDASGAVAAYKQALRLAPENEDAKYNLELALRQLQKERQAKKPQETPQGQRPGEQEHSEGSGSKDPSEGKRDPSDARDPGANQQQGQQGQQAGQQAGQQPGQQQKPGEQKPGLGSWKDQPDMTAQQAAALLEAVENLERQQRKAELAQKVRKAPKGTKDW